jgi:hypothetical protein
MIVAGGAGVVGAAASLAGQAPADTTKVQGHPTTDVGQRSPFEKPARLSFGGRRSASQTPLQDLEGIITPADLHFERHHGGVPTIDPSTYSLLIHGMVERPLVFTLDDLKRFPGRSVIRFLECSGNGSRGHRPDPKSAETTPQLLDGLTSTSEWTGVPLATLLREVGASPKATWFLAESMDASPLLWLGFGANPRHCDRPRCREGCARTGDRAGQGPFERRLLGRRVSGRHASGPRYDASLQARRRIPGEEGPRTGRAGRPQCRGVLAAKCMA